MNWPCGCRSLKAPLQLGVPEANSVYQSRALPAMRSRGGTRLAVPLHYNGSGWQEVEGVIQMALYRRKEAGIWYADFYANGERVQESTGTANKREAEKFLALRISEAQRGVYVKPVHVPLPELWERYFAYARTHKRSWKRDEQ